MLLGSRSLQIDSRLRSLRGRGFRGRGSGSGATYRRYVHHGQLGYTGIDERHSGSWPPCAFYLRVTRRKKIPCGTGGHILSIKNLPLQYRTTAPYLHTSLVHYHIINAPIWRRKRSSATSPSNRRRVSKSILVSSHPIYFGTAVPVSSPQGPEVFFGAVVFDAGAGSGVLQPYTFGRPVCTNISSHLKLLIPPFSAFAVDSWFGRCGGIQ